MSDALFEHVSYLSLPNRSDLYRSAISTCVASGSSVADLGCGVGVLGIFCLEAGASHVWGIDNSDAIHLANETIKNNGLEAEYTCIASSTFHAQLPDPVDALICDHVGYFGIDYGIIDMIRDAAKRMLKPGGTIIPESLTLHVAGVNSDHCRDKASAWSKDIIPERFRWIDEQARNTTYSHDFSPEELCSSPAKLGSVKLDADTPDYFSFEAEILVTETGRFDGFAGWFNAHLGGGVWMTNSPLDPESIKRSQAFFPVVEPFEVNEGDVVAVTLRIRPDGNLYAWNVAPPDGATTLKQSNWGSTILTEGDRAIGGSDPVVLNDRVKAQLYILSLVDGKRSGKEIEEIVVRENPDLLPSLEATRDLVRDVLRRSAVS
ncbi:methyltransferase [Erythrobacter sp. F6033]|uniref:methyltransferase n=1 Tax=Erythrobacter sp. F6033 TaxID=2926401 RepID=UPI001FF1D35B|nr:methyltransferase [Erythrobacter sp. F6033]MCK0127179.1 class I SAM-dependent methyltransferase [Erythrobacter sp. F6033]